MAQCLSSKGISKVSRTGNHKIGLQKELLTKILDLYKTPQMNHSCNKTKRGQTIRNIDKTKRPGVQQTLYTSP